MRPEWRRRKKNEVFSRATGGRDHAAVAELNTKRKGLSHMGIAKVVRLFGRGQKEEKLLGNTPNSELAPGERAAPKLPC